MLTTKLWKTVSLTALLTALSIPVAMAGATNKGDNTAATPGEDSTTTTTPSDANAGARDDIRTGTTKDVKPTKRGDKKKSGSASGSSSDTGSGSTSGSGASDSTSGSGTSTGGY